MTGSNWPIRHVSVVAGVLLTLAIPSSAQAKPSDKPRTEQNGSPGGSADKDQKAEKSDKKDVDTEHLFGFTEGADAGDLPPPGGPGIELVHGWPLLHGSLGRRSRWGERSRPSGERG